MNSEILTHQCDNTYDQCRLQNNCVDRVDYSNNEISECSDMSEEKPAIPSEEQEHEGVQRRNWRCHVRQRLSRDQLCVLHTLENCTYGS